MKKLLIIGTVAVCVLIAHGEDDDDAYTCAGLIPPPPTPEELEAKRQARLATAQAIPWDDTDITNRVRRVRAIKEFVGAVNTNSLAYLSSVWRNPDDPAKYHALLSAISLSLRGRATSGRTSWWRS